MGREIEVHVQPSVPGCGGGTQLCWHVRSAGEAIALGGAAGSQHCSGCSGQLWTLLPSILLIRTGLSTGKTPQNYGAGIPSIAEWYVCDVWVCVLVYVLPAHRGTHRHACLFYPELSSPGQCTSLPLDIPNVDDAGLFSSVATAVNY